MTMLFAQFCLDASAPELLADLLRAAEALGHHLLCVAHTELTKLLASCMDAIVPLIDNIANGEAVDCGDATRKETACA